jgi:N-acetylglucosamine malate deacetylase 1
MPRKHLIIAPHVDDAEFGLGGSIQEWSSVGDEVKVVIAAGGNYQRSDGLAVQGSLRAHEAREAFTILGVKEWELSHWFDENNPASIRYGDLVRNIEVVIQEQRPTDTYVCLPSFNQDHRALFDATITAFRPANLPGNLWAYEYPGNCWGPSPPEFGKMYLWFEETTLARKIEALNCHKSQWEGRKVGVNPKSATSLAQQRGSEIGKDYAELIYLLRGMS